MKTLAAWVCALAAATGLGAARRPDPQPFTAYVATDDALIYSGPGGSYYPTESLGLGTELVVYRQEEGWCAVRPPRRSFSWVSARFLKVGKDGLAEVVADNVACRVGSHLSELRDTVQVRLKRGEIVEVRGARQVGTDSQASLWYKIASPSGEFRWIERKYLSSRRPITAESVVRQPASRSDRSEVADAPAVAKGRKEDGAMQDPAVVPAVGVEEDAAETPPRRSVSPSAETNPAVRPQPLSAILGEGPLRNLPAPGPVARQLTPQEFQDELDDVNLELSVLLAEKPAAWSVEHLAERAASLERQARTEVERIHARTLVQRIVHADDLKRRFASLDAGATSPAVNPNVPAGPAAPADVSRAVVQTPSERATGPGERYDGMGRLTRVAPNRAGTARYALVDGKGDIRAYVNPAPGVNMNYYVGRQVGITGSRTVAADQRSEYVTAKHITPLDTQLR
jgi:hypothetical protein